MVKIKIDLLPSEFIVQSWSGTWQASNCGTSESLVFRNGRHIWKFFVKRLRNLFHWKNQMLKKNCYYIFLTYYSIWSSLFHIYFFASGNDSGSITVNNETSRVFTGFCTCKDYHIEYKNVQIIQQKVIKNGHVFRQSSILKS